MPDSSYVEVRCERCKTSFAPGTKQCIHCGGPIGRRLLSFDGAAGRPSAAASGPGQAPNAPDAQPALGRIMRLAVFGLVAVSVVVRACVESR